MRVGCIGPDSDSTRVRFEQFGDAFAAAGLDTRTLRWAPRSSWESARLWARARSLVGWADVVVLVKPRLPGRLTDLLARRNGHLIVDVDDATWTWSPEVARRWRHALGRARLAIAGSETLAGEVRAMAGATPVRCIRPAVDVGAYPSRRARRDGPVVVGWVGGRHSLDDFVDPAVAGLAGLVGGAEAELRVVCSAPLERPDLATTFVPWRLDTEAAAVGAFDIGIMPLRDDATSRGRCGLKVIQYMAAGLPVVASPVGVARELVEPGHTGFLAETADEWAEALRTLVRSPEQRAEMGARARARAEVELDRGVAAEQLVRAFADVRAGREALSPGSE